MEILAIIVTAIGIGVAVYQIMHKSKIDTYSWNKIEEEIDSLYNQIHRSQFKPDVMVSCPNGGLIVADILHTKHMKDAPVLSVNVLRVSGNSGPKTVTLVSEIKKGYFKGKKILIVDDIINSGVTMREILNYLQSDGANEIKTCCLGRTKYEAGFKPDMSCFEYSGQVSLPWGVAPK